MRDAPGETMPKHIVVAGECMSSIAKTYGFTWDVIYNHPKNAKLREKRPDPNVLFPGDVVAIPEAIPIKVQRQTGRVHELKVVVPRAILRLKLMLDGEPLANETYELLIDQHEQICGTTDGDGFINEKLSPDAKSVRLFVGEERVERELRLGHVDPVDSIAGLQQRLNNLGFTCPSTGELCDRTRGAFQAFQQQNSLEVSDAPNQATFDKLLTAHGC
jgi:N-acetylmuramoyl-L-alanine amidase